MNNLFRSKPAPKPVPDDFPQGPLPRALPAVATHAYEANDVLELQLRADQRLHILEAKGEWWFIARSYKKIPGTNQLEEGWAPSSYVRLLESPQSIDMAKAFNAWIAKVAAAFSPPRVQDSSVTRAKIDHRAFPWLPPEVCACEESSCWLRKQEYSLGACVHDVEVLIKGAGEKYTAHFLWKMSLGWHPDKFVKKFREGFAEEGEKAVREMFNILTELSLKERGKEEKAKREKVV